MKITTEQKKNKYLEWILTGIAAGTFITGIFFSAIKLPFADWFYYASLLVGGLPVARAAIRTLLRRKISINILVTIAAIGALYLGQTAEAAAVMFFFALAESFEKFGKARSQKAIAALLERSPKLARLQDGREVAVENVSIGQIIKILPGDLMPLDGIVSGGESAVDEAAITGESVPKEKYTGQTVFAGTLNQNGYLEVKVTKTASNTTLSKIIVLIQQAQKSKPEMQEFLDKFASFYIPAAIALAALVVIIPTVFFGQPFSDWLTRGLILLVLACPDALVVSAPVAVAAAMGGASRKGVLIKGGKFLETLSKTKVFAFDKTKTLTEGSLKVTEVVAVHGASKQEVLSDAAGLEKFSSHPLAAAIQKYAAENGVAVHAMENFKNIPGRGGLANCMVCPTKDHAIGNLQHIGASMKVCEDVLKEVERMESLGMTTVIVSEGPKAVGIIGITDRLREESKNVIASLNSLGVMPVMLTGDNERAARHIAEQIGINEVYAGLLPDQKAELVRVLQQRYGKVAMVGDGVNDAPSLARADVGIAMGGGGSDVAIETADITLMNDALGTIPYLLRLGRRTFRAVQQNVYGSLVVKGAILLLGLFGLVRLDVAVAVDAGAAIVVIINGLRLFNVK